MNDSDNPSLKDRTEYLVLRKYPFARAIEFPPPINVGSRPKLRARDVSPQMREALAAYRAELAALSPAEIIKRYTTEKQQEYQRAVEKAELDEQQRFFNRLPALADFEHWSKMARWTLEEAIALSFGKAPEVVNWPSLSPFSLISPFAIQYGRRRQLVLRAAQQKQLYDPVLPGIFLAWAKELEIAAPAALVQAVEKRGPILNWKSLFDELKALHEKKEENWTASDQAKDRTIAAKQRVVDVLEERVRNLEAQQADKPVEKSLSTRERESLLKLVIGMAVGGYGYDSTARRSEQTTAIADDLAQAGISLDADTVRKWLREAAELLPPK